MDFTATLAGVARTGDGFTAHLAPNWVQGRAGFGGLVAALGLAAIRADSGLDWTLRSLSVAFVGPAVGDLSIQVRKLRQGRTAAFWQADLLAGGEVGTTVTACLGPDRESRARCVDDRMPTVPAPDDCMAMPFLEGIVPTFLKNLDVRMAAGTIFDGSGSRDLIWWVRHRDTAAWGTEAGFIGLLDTLPPAAAGMIRGPFPLSSLTWMVDLPGTGFDTADGWYLLRSTTDYAGNGFTGQAMEAWSRDGRLVARHRQMVAMFA
jgi:acyl-CoA thioesterase